LAKIAGSTSVPTRGVGASALQAAHELGVFGRIETALQHGEQPVEVFAHQSGGIEPQSGEERAVEGPALIRSEFLKSTIPQNEPINLAVVDALDYVLANTVAFVSAQLFVQVVADATSGNLGHKLGRAHDVAVLVKCHLAVTTGLDEEHGIGLGRTTHVEKHRAVVSQLGSRRSGAIVKEPADERRVRIAVMPVSNG
jgi:hypothetical protein